MKKSSKLAILSILSFVAVLASMCNLYLINIAQAASTEEDWLMFRHDLLHSGNSNASAPDKNSTIWTYTTGGEVFSSPAVAGGKVYVGSADGYLYCFNTSEGSLIWNYSTGAGIWSSPAVSDGKVYVGSDDARIYCFDALTGAQVWNFTTGDSVESSPSVADGKVYIGSFDGYVYCLNATNGSQIWRHMMNGGWGVYSSPALSDDRVYVGSGYMSGTPDVECLNASTGELIWSRFVLWADIWSSPSLGEGRVYIGMSYQVYCLNASDGTVIWNYPLASDSSPAIVGEKLYVGTTSGNLCCLDASNGTSIWNYTTGGEVWSSPAVADGKVYVGSVDNRIYCLDASNGTMIWSYLTNGYVGSSPAIAGGRVYVGSNDYKLYAFEDVYSLTVTAGEGGSTDPVPGTHAYVEGTTITATATPLVGYAFDHWEFDGSLNSSNPISVTMNSDHSLKAVFSYNVTIAAYCTTEGSNVSVDITMDGSATGYATTHSFTVSGGTHNFTVPAEESSGHCFKRWDTNETDTTLLINSPGTCTAYYQAKYNLTITEVDGGTVSPEPGNYTYWDGTQVNVSATPSLGYLLDHWEFDTVDIGNVNPITVNMNASHTLRAVFSWVGTCNLTITTTEGGTTDPIPGIYMHTNGTSANVTAFNSEGFSFGYWELDTLNVGSQNPITVIMDSDHALNAVFTYSVTIDSYCYKEDGNANVSIIMDGLPTGYNTPQVFNLTGTHNFTLPDIDLNEHYLKYWNTNETSSTITISSAGTYTAYYQARHNLTITVTDGGTTDPPPGSYSYWNGTTVDVTANSTLGYALDHWELNGSNVGSPNPITIVMDNDLTLNAVFKIVYTLEITATEGGTTNPPAGSHLYFEETIVTINATPSIDYGFDHWELDGLWNYSNPIDVTMNFSHTLHAVFNYNVTIDAFCFTDNVSLSLNITMDYLPTNFTTPHTFTLTGTHNFTLPETDPSEHPFEQWDTGVADTTITVTSPVALKAQYKAKWKLTIESASGGTTDPPPGQDKYWDETSVNVTALPDLGYVLDHWNLDGSSAGSLNPTSVTMDTDHTLQPVFSWVGIYNLTISTTTGGTTFPAPGTHEYTNGTLAIVTANAYTDYGLHHWELNGSEVGSQNPITIAMDSDYELKAIFKAIFTLTITSSSNGTTNPAPGSYQEWEGTLVACEATAFSGYSFDHWELDGSWNYTNPITVTMNSSRTLHAVFTYEVTIVAYCNSEAKAVALPIFMDGLPTSYVTPHTFAHLNGTHTFSIPNADGEDHPFTQWDTGSRMLSVTVSITCSHTAYYEMGRPGGVGGLGVPVDKLGLLVPYIWVVSIILAATVATGIHFKRVRGRKEKR